MRALYEKARELVDRKIVATEEEADLASAPPGNGDARERPDPQVPREPAPVPIKSAGRAPQEGDDDEDSQIKFLGWSDQPELLRSSGRDKAPITNPSPRYGEYAGRRSGGMDGKPEGKRGDGRWGFPRRSGPYTGPQQAGSAGGGPRRNGRRNGRRRRRD